MKKEMIVCDSCEKVLYGGGIRVTSESRSADPIDLCPECIAEVLGAYSEETGQAFLSAVISDEDFQVLSGPEDSEEEFDETDDSVASHVPQAREGSLVDFRLVQESAKKRLVLLEC